MLRKKFEICKICKGESDLNTLKTASEIATNVNIKFNWKVESIRKV